MQDPLSNRVKHTETSATMALAVLATQLKNQGVDVINLGIGEPDFDTPPSIKHTAIAAIEEGFTKYTPVDGILSLKEAIAHKLKRDNQLDFTPQEILVSPGSKLALYLSGLALLNPGDEVIIPTPYWPSYPEIFKLAEGVPVFIHSTAENYFKITPDQLKKAITAKTKLILFNSPNNPSGMAYTKAEWDRLAAVLIKHPQIFIVSDDIYEYIFWGKEPFVNLLNVCPALKNRFILISGVSKNHAMTGWRIGFAAAPVAITQALLKLQSQIIGSPTSISQKAALKAFQTPKEDIAHMFTVYKERHDFVYDALSQMSYVRCLRSDGTFYLFVDVTQVIARFKLNSDVELCTELLNKAWVSLVPGTFFGMPGFVRLSFSVHINQLKEAIKRLKEWF